MHHLYALPATLAEHLSRRTRSAADIDGVVYAAANNRCQLHRASESLLHVVIALKRCSGGCRPFRAIPFSPCSSDVRRVSANQPDFCSILKYDASEQDSVVPDVTVAVLSFICVWHEPHAFHDYFKPDERQVTTNSLMVLSIIICAKDVSRICIKWSSET